MVEIRLEYVHRGQTYLTASHSQLRYFVIFLISRRDGENDGFLAGVPLLPPPSRVVSRPNSLSLPFRTPATQASKSICVRRFSPSALSLFRFHLSPFTQKRLILRLKRTELQKNINKKSLSLISGG